MYLVEGGRWLLVASNTGSVSYFDLDASTPIESILIPDQFDYISKSRISMAIDRDCDSALLTFNLLVARCSNSTDEDTPTFDYKEHGIQVWRVALALDDKQQGIGFTAVHLASFPLERSITRVYALSIRGSYLALLLNLTYNVHVCESRFAFVIDWKLANGDLRNYPRRLVYPLDGVVGLTFLNITIISCLSLLPM